MNGRTKKLVSVVIPAYNEGENIGNLLEKLIKQPEYEIIVVDDGSTDNTAEIVSKFGNVHLIRHPYNIGNGAAVRKGIQNARNDIIVCMDADGQHDPDEIPKLLGYFPEFDMVIGSRLNNRHVSAFRAFGNRILKRVAEFLSGHKIMDLTSGYRAMKRKVIVEVLHLFPNRYSYPTTSVLAFLSCGYPIKYLPLSSIVRRKKGKSSIKPFLDGLRFINIMLRMIMLFNPQKIFTPVSALFFFTGVFLGIRSAILFNKVVQSASIMIVVGITVFLFGLLSDQISNLIRKSH